MTGHMLDGWYSFELAAEEVERRLGVSWGSAQKTVMELCEKGILKWENIRDGGPNVSYNDLQQWLTKKTNRSGGGKQARIISELEKMFNGAPVPERTLRPRKALKEDLLGRDKSLRPLDLSTLKTAIDKYNSTI
jgi:hypothetical protein